MTTVLDKEVLYGPATNGDEGKPNRKEKTFRLQLVLPEASYERLESLKEATEASSYAEVIRRALRIYEGLVAESEVGSKIIVHRLNGDEEVISIQLIA